MNDRAMEPLPPDEELLRDLVLGERDLADPAVRRALEASPALRERWEALRASGSGLDALGRLEAQVLAELASAEDAEPAGWDRRARESLRGLGVPSSPASPAPQAPGSTRRPWLPILAASAAVAASLLVGFFVLRPRGSGDGAGPAVPGAGGPGDTYLGSPTEAPQLREPLGTLERSELTSFRWAYTPAGPWEGSCQVIVYDPSGDELARSTAIPRPVDGGDWRWTPTAKELGTLRAAGSFLWQVSAAATVGFSASSSLGSVSLR